jgi:hypothetical protein
MAEEPALRLLTEIAADLGETKGIVAEVRTELREHRHEDRTDLRMLGMRLGKIEERQAQRVALDEAQRHGEARRAGIMAAIVAGIVSVAGQVFPHWWGK